MAAINKNECVNVLKSYLNSDNFEIIDFHVAKSSNASIGFLGGALSLYCKILTGQDIKKCEFFVKTLPVNKFQRECVINSGIFLKEMIFYQEIVSGLKKYLPKKILPECYFADKEKIVLEDLSIVGFRNSNLNGYFDFKHCIASLKALAEFHAASFLYERELGIRVDERFPDITGYSWFPTDKDHPGNMHLMTGIRALACVIDKYFTDQPKSVRNEIVQMFERAPEQLKPSKLHRNCLSHVDLWCNNIMFKYNSENEPESAVLIDFQLFGYNPPTLDLLMLIYLNTDRPTRKTNFDKFISIYYLHFCNILKNHGFNSDSVLDYHAFSSSMSETLEATLSLTIIYLHYILIPNEEIFPILNDVDKYRRFLCENRSEFILYLVDKYPAYRESLFEVINDIIDYVTHK